MEQERKLMFLCIAVIVLSFSGCEAYSAKWRAKEAIARIEISIKKIEAGR